MYASNPFHKACIGHEHVRSQINLAIKDTKSSVRNVPPKHKQHNTDSYFLSRTVTSNASACPWQHPYIKLFTRIVMSSLPFSDEGLSFGQRIADQVASLCGSWPFILIQLSLVCVWACLNVLYSWAWDPYPYILLNLCLSFQAAYATPIIMMSQNRSAEVDRYRASSLNEKVDQIRIAQFTQLWDTMKEQTDRMLGILRGVTKVMKKIKKLRKQMQIHCVEEKRNRVCPKCNHVMHDNGEMNIIKEPAAIAENLNVPDVEVELLADLGSLQNSITEMRRHLSLEPRTEAASNEYQNEGSAMIRMSSLAIESLNDSYVPVESQQAVSTNLVTIELSNLHEKCPSLKLTPKHLLQNYSISKSHEASSDDTIDKDDEEWKEILETLCIQPERTMTDGEELEECVRTVSVEPEGSLDRFCWDFDQWWEKSWRVVIFRGNFVDEDITFGQQMAQIFSDGIGSWTFTICQTLLLITWILLNIELGSSSDSSKTTGAWDPYPFILLNLCLSTQAAFSGPLILMSQNRQGDVDRQHSVIFVCFAVQYSQRGAPQFRPHPRESNACNW